MRYTGGGGPARYGILTAVTVWEDLEGVGPNESWLAGPFERFFLLGEFSMSLSVSNSGAWPGRVARDWDGVEDVAECLGRHRPRDFLLPGEETRERVGEMEASPWGSESATGA